MSDCEKRYLHPELPFSSVLPISDLYLYLNNFTVSFDWLKDFIHRYNEVILIMPKCVCIIFLQLLKWLVAKTVFACYANRKRRTNQWTIP